MIKVPITLVTSDIPGGADFLEDHGSLGEDAGLSKVMLLSLTFSVLCLMP
jgi:hypothetical protein